MKSKESNREVQNYQMTKKIVKTNVGKKPAKFHKHKPEKARPGEDTEATPPESGVHARIACKRGTLHNSATSPECTEAVNVASRGVCGCLNEDYLFLSQHNSKSAGDNKPSSRTAVMQLGSSNLQILCVVHWACLDVPSTSCKQNTRAALSDCQLL